MSLPDLPKTANIKYMAMNQDGTANGVAYAYTAQDMQAYGQSCREQALMDAMNATLPFGKVGIVIASAIRSLK